MEAGARWPIAAGATAGRWGGDMTLGAQQQHGHDRMYIEARIREEIARSRRYGHPFAIVTFEAIPGTDGVPVHTRVDAVSAIIQQQVRPSDVVARAFDDVIVLLLVETDAAGASDAVFRLRSRLQGHGRWTITTYTFPADADAIAALPALHVA
jgi:hypothetical protein